jgi:pyruvate-formate lyase-activating enzyme
MKSENPRLLFATPDGKIYDHPSLEAAGMIGYRFVRLHAEDVIDLPYLSKLFFLPGCPPVGYDTAQDQFVILETEEMAGRRVPCAAVACLLQSGYARTHLPAAEYCQKQDILPLWAYTAVGASQRGLRAAGFQVEYNPAWDPAHYDDRDLMPALKEIMKRHGKNRLFRHLAHCATEYHCFAAKNLFLRRWEAPLPVSRHCNARCLGCLSFQSPGACQPSHERIAFVPTAAEVAEAALFHLDHASDPIVSFGQGCEGEPLTEHRLLTESIRRIRDGSDRGTINLNTNGSMPGAVRRIVESGLDSIRISLNSARKPLYDAYFLPVDYGLEDVISVLRYCRGKNLYTMVNYLIFPGISDQEAEIEALLRLIRETGIHFLHFKNLNIDPYLYLASMPAGDSPAVGMKKMAEILTAEIPDLQIGYFNQPVEKGINLKKNSES